MDLSLRRWDSAVMWKSRNRKMPWVDQLPKQGMDNEEKRPTNGRGRWPLLKWIVA